MTIGPASLDATRARHTDDLAEDHAVGRLAFQQREGGLNALNSSASLLYAYALPRLGRTAPSLATGAGLAQYGAPIVSREGSLIGTQPRIVIPTSLTCALCLAPKDCMSTPNPRRATPNLPNLPAAARRSIHTDELWRGLAVARVDSGARRRGVGIWELGIDTVHLSL
jgi:hypothetical protein